MDSLDEVPGDRAGALIAGRRIVDLGGEYGAYCTKVLADMGAEVLKVELPGGDRLRALPPIGPATRPDVSARFEYYHANKRGITLDFRRPDAGPLLERIVTGADVIVMSPSRRVSLTGFGPDDSWPSWAPEQSVVCSITPFGLTGPYRDWRATNLTCHAMGGGLLRYGPLDGPPIVMPGHQAIDETGVHAAATILAALVNRRAVGGQLLDLAVHEVLSGKDDLIHRYGTAGTILRREERSGLPPSGSWECRDGMVNIGAFLPRHWEAFLDAIGRPESLTRPEFRDRMTRLQRWEELTKIISSHMATISAPVFVQTAQALGLPCARLNTPEEFLSDEQTANREFWRQIDGADGWLKVAGNPFIASGLFRSETDRRPAPWLGQHNREIYLGELQLSCEELRHMERTGLV